MGEDGSTSSDDDNSSNVSEDGYLSDGLVKVEVDRSGGRKTTWNLAAHLISDPMTPELLRAEEGWKEDVIGSRIGLVGPRRLAEPDTLENIDSATEDACFYRPSATQLRALLQNSLEATYAQYTCR
jgi:hypothetical protein